MKFPSHLLNLMNTNNDCYVLLYFESKKKDGGDPNTIEYTDPTFYFEGNLSTYLSPELLKAVIKDVFLEKPLFKDVVEKPSSLVSQPKKNKPDPKKVQVKDKHPAGRNPKGSKPKGKKSAFSKSKGKTSSPGDK